VLALLVPTLGLGAAEPAAGDPTTGDELWSPPVPTAPTELPFCTHATKASARLEEIPNPNHFRSMLRSIANPHSRVARLERRPLSVTAT
jgi:hypothetical protein